MEAWDPKTEIGIITEAKENTESGEVGVLFRTLQILYVLCGSISDLGRTLEWPGFRTRMRACHLGRFGPGAEGAVVSREVPRVVHLEVPAEVSPVAYSLVSSVAPAVAQRAESRAASRLGPVVVRRVVQAVVRCVLPSVPRSVVRFVARFDAPSVAGFVASFDAS